MLKRKTKDWYRFWGKVSFGPGCWLWIQSTDRDGYGVFRLNNAQVRSHRVTYEIKHGSIPKGFCVCHICDTTGCVRPSHLFLGTSKDNKRDAMSKARDSCGEKHFNSKLTEEQIKLIRKDTRSLRTIAKEYGLSSSHVGKIKNRKSWKHIT